MGAAATTRPTLHLHLSPYANKPELQQRLRKIEGQVRGIERMVEDERYCVDILTQIAAVRAALDRVSLQLLEAHVEGCVSDAIRSGQGEPYIRELMSVFTRLIR
ncbi:MAG: metal-sensitive transcriptional regulator [Bacillota bacterium]|nr:metal-sensitive transcriptional regulator [Bacillota bacterium]